MLAIDLSTDPVVRAFFQDFGNDGGEMKANEGCTRFRQEQFGSASSDHARVRDFRDVVREANFISAICRLLGTEIPNRRRSEERQIALINAVYLGAGEPLESVLDARHVAANDKRVQLGQETLLGLACTFDTDATLGEFTS